LLLPYAAHKHKHKRQRSTTQKSSSSQASRRPHHQQQRQRQHQHQQQCWSMQTFLVLLLLVLKTPAPLQQQQQQLTPRGSSSRTSQQQQQPSVRTQLHKAMRWRRRKQLLQQQGCVQRMLSAVVTRAVPPVTPWTGCCSWQRWRHSSLGCQQTQQQQQVVTQQRRAGWPTMRYGQARMDSQSGPRWACGVRVGLFWRGGGCGSMICHASILGVLQHVA
jgi:hypothetical protein